MIITSTPVASEATGVRLTRTSLETITHVIRNSVSELVQWCSLTLRNMAMKVQDNETQRSLSLATIVRGRKTFSTF